MWELPIEVNNTSMCELCILGEFEDRTTYELVYFKPELDNFTGEPSNIYKKKFDLVYIKPLIINK